MSRFYSHALPRNAKIKSNVGKSRATILLEDLDRVVTDVFLLLENYDDDPELIREVAAAILQGTKTHIAGNDLTGLRVQEIWLGVLAGMLYASVPPYDPAPADDPGKLAEQGQKHIDELGAAIASIEPDKDRDDLDEPTPAVDELPDDLDAYDADETRPDVNDA